LIPHAIDINGHNGQSHYAEKSRISHREQKVMDVGHSEGQPKPKQEGAGEQRHSPLENETGLYRLERQSGDGWEQKRPASSCSS